MTVDYIPFSGPISMLRAIQEKGEPVKWVFVHK